MGILVGVDIGGTKTAVVLAKARGNALEIIDREVFLTEPEVLSWRETVERIVGAARLLLGRHAAAGPAAGIGISCGGPLDNAAGLIMDGRLYEGTNGLAGEAGHIRLSAEGPEGYGKKGSFEGYCSGGGIARFARDEAEMRLVSGQMVAFCPGWEALLGISAEAVGKAAEAGDPLALEIFALSGRFLGRALALIIDLLNPQRIVIGSIYARCRRFIEPSMKEEIAREALAPAVHVCELVPAALGGACPQEGEKR